jgi:glycosyltransferase involved in cell wall biosynthesis
MAVHNAAPFLREAVSSALDQTYSDFELIAVDDASSDESLAILGSFEDARIRVVRNDKNMGAAFTRNAALLAARGEFVAIMDADDVCVPARLAKQVAFLDANPLVGLVGCGVYDNIDESGAVLYTSYLPEDNETIQRTLIERWCFLHPSIMFRRSLYELVGGYRKEFDVAEDHDFILRMLEHCQAHNLCESLVSYRLNPRGLSVVCHEYITELGNIAMLLAKRRRDGQPEDLEAELGRLRELKRMRSTPRGFGGIIQRWNSSLYAANRYYGFGCRELCAGHLERARRCFLRSLRTNYMFIKSWIGFAISLMPPAASRLKVTFRASMQLEDQKQLLRPARRGLGHPDPFAGKATGH